MCHAAARLLELQPGAAHLLDALIARLSAEAARSLTGLGRPAALQPIVLVNSGTMAAAVTLVDEFHHAAAQFRGSARHDFVEVRRPIGLPADQFCPFVFARLELLFWCCASALDKAKGRGRP